MLVAPDVADVHRVPPAKAIPSIWGHPAPMGANQTKVEFTGGDTPSCEMNDKWLKLQPGPSGEPCHRIYDLGRGVDPSRGSEDRVESRRAVSGRL